MFLKLNQISKALEQLQGIHQFYGITFLTCKVAELPVGHATEIAINAKDKEFLDKYYKPDSQSNWYYRVFRLSNKGQHWLKPDYSHSGLQSTRTRDLGEAFIHTKGTNLWGWKENYVHILKDNLMRNRKPYEGKSIPAFYLAVWLLRDRDWPGETTAEQVVQVFFREFSITEDEQLELFDAAIPKDVHPELLQELPTTWSELCVVNEIPPPPDILPDEEGTLAYLEIEGVGPARRIRFDPAERLNLITGDNGLGKTFLLECAWWALTGQWAGLPAYPRLDAKRNEPKITFQIALKTGLSPKTSISYNWDAIGADKWPSPKRRPTIPGLLIYARVDGSFAVCDPVGKAHPVNGNAAMPRSFVFTRDQIWNGFIEEDNGQKKPRINGLIYDWVLWQSNPEKYPFETFVEVLKILSPPRRGDLGELRPGESVRLPEDSREIPTLEHPYGIVPIVHAAAGVKRIVTLAYLIVWAWYEHNIRSQEARKSPQKRIVVLLDELEAHLHPQWQRRILPALLEVKGSLNSKFDLQIQTIVATHSPLVMASAEPTFNPDTDKLFHLDMNDSLFGSEIIIDEMPFIKRGLVDHWLTSEVFELNQARSLEAESAIEHAKRLQQQESPDQQEIREVSAALQNLLSEVDVFWPRWTFFAEKNGVEL